MNRTQPPFYFPTALGSHVHSRATRVVHRLRTHHFCSTFFWRSSYTVPLTNAHLCAEQPNMSATDGHDISDIHTSTVGESLSDPGAHGIDASEAGHSVGVEHHPNIPAVGASVSISDPSAAVSINERSSTALLNLASSCSLTEILNVQQQALEQFQCQLQLAQQNEAINQRLDAIERTLNNLIHQKAQEEAVRSVGGQSVTPIRPSQQLDASVSGSSNESKKKKLPRELCVSFKVLKHFFFLGES